MEFDGVSRNKRWRGVFLRFTCQDLKNALAISFWKTQQDAESYQREQFAKVNDIVRPTLESEPDVRTFEVDTATNYKIARGKAA